MVFVKIKLLAKDSLIYGVSGIISKLIVVLLVPVYTRIFTPEDYGVINLINTTFLLVGIFAVCAMDNAASRWFYETDDEYDRRTSFASWFWFQLGLSVLIAIVFILFTPLALKYLLNIESNPANNLLWILPSLGLLFNILPNMIWNWYRFQRKAISTVVFTLSQSLTTIILTICLVVVYPMGILGVFAALICSGILFSAIAFFILRGWISLTYFSLNRLKEMLQFSLPLIPASVAGWLLTGAGSYFILAYAGKAEVGLFAIGNSMASVVTLFTGSFQQAWGPFALSIMRDKDAKNVYAKVLLLFGACASVLVLMMFLFSSELLMLFTTTQYYGAAMVAALLALNIIITSFSYIAITGSTIVKTNKYYSVGVIAGALVTIFLHTFLIPIFGKEGAALSMITAQIFAVAFVFYHSQKLYPIPYNFFKLMQLLLPAIGLGLITFYLMQTATMAAGILIKLAVLLIYMGLSYLMLKKEWLQIKDVINVERAEK